MEVTRQVFENPQMLTRKGSPAVRYLKRILLEVTAEQINKIENAHVAEQTDSAQRKCRA